MKSKVPVLVLMALLVSVVGNQTAAQQKSDDSINLQSTLVSVPVLVSDRAGRYFPGLTIQDFKLFEDRTERKIELFDNVEEPINVALLLDTSKSTAEVLDTIRKDATNFLKELRPQDRAMVVSFDYAVHLMSPLTSDRKALERAIKKCEIGEYVGTTLRDAVADVIGRHFKRIDGRKAIVLLTDGKDVGSEISEEQVLDQATESGAMIYSVFFETEFGRGLRNGGMSPRPGWGGWRRRYLVDPDPAQAPNGGRPQRGAVRNERAQKFLTDLSEASAGRFFRSDVVDLNKTFNQIAEELRHQYRLGFYPDFSKADGQRHSLRVEVTKADAVVRARRSYQAASAASKPAL